MTSVNTHTPGGRRRLLLWGGRRRPTSRCTPPGGETVAAALGRAEKTHEQIHTPGGGNGACS
eukprot:6470223-Amphidinium_carterae.1